MQMRTKIRVLNVAFLIGASVFAASANANLVSDGNFNSPPGASPFTTYNDGQSFGPWTVSGSVDLIGDYWQSPPGGGGSVDLDGNSPGIISQVLNLAAGDYELSFALSGNPDGGDPRKAFFVSVGDLYKPTFFFDTSSSSRTSMNFIEEALPFHAAGGPTTLRFVSLTDGAYGAVIGNVSVTAVPEPATAALVVLGLGVMGFAARRRRHDSMSAAHA